MVDLITYHKPQLYPLHSLSTKISSSNIFKAAKPLLNPRRSTSPRISRLSSSFLSTRSLLSLDSSYRSVTTNTDFSSEGAQVSLDACKDRWVNHLLTNPDLQIAVIGGGIYGCHFAQAFNVACSEASSILNKAIGAKLVIFEKDDALFSQASGKNSFRIHKGFHYPRTGNTRSMCYNDHNKFVHQYPHFFQTAFDEEKNKDIPASSRCLQLQKMTRPSLIMMPCVTAQWSKISRRSVHVG